MKSKRKEKTESVGRKMRGKMERKWKVGKNIEKNRRKKGKEKIGDKKEKKKRKN